MSTRLKALVAMGIAAAALGMAAPASAAEPNPAWNRGFPSGSAIGSSLGAFEAKPMLDIAAFTERWYVCSDLKAKAGTDIAEATYTAKPLTPRSMTTTARVYASDAKAKAAFKAIVANLDKCSGSRIVVSEPGSSDKWRVVTSVGETPDTMIDGTASVFTYDQSTPAKGSTAKAKTSWAGYQLLSLEGDSILVTEASLPGVSKFTSSQMDAVAAFATDFAGTWAKANG